MPDLPILCPECGGEWNQKVGGCKTHQRWLDFWTLIQYGQDNGIEALDELLREANHAD